MHRLYFVAKQHLANTGMVVIKRLIGSYKKIIMNIIYFYFVKPLRGVCEINFAGNRFRDKSRNPGSGARDSSRALSTRNLFRRKTTPLPFQASAFL